jgi:hypothetical protein
MSSSVIPQSRKVQNLKRSKRMKESNQIEPIIRQIK